MTWERTSKRKSCDGCPFYGARVGTRGPEDSPFMIIGESPGKEELRGGEPFVGVSWQVLNHAIKQSGMEIPEGYEPYVTNTMHCFPGNNKSPEKMATATKLCRHHLVEEINRHPRKLILTLGSPALQAITNDSSKRITAWRGKYVKDELWNDIQGVEHAICTIHPAFILRGGGSYRQFQGDIRYALSLLNGGDVVRTPDVQYLVCDSDDLLRRLLGALRDRPRGSDVAADIETGSPPDDPDGPGGFSHIDDSILVIGIGWNASHVYFIPEEFIMHPLVKAIFELEHINWVWHNGKFDIKFLWSFGHPKAVVNDDTMLMSYALDERRGLHDLETVANDWLMAPSWKAMLDKHKRKKQSYRVIPKDVLYQYAAYDVRDTWRLAQIQRPVIQADPDTKRIYERTFIPASQYLAKVEDWGILVDKERVKANHERIHAAMEPYAEIIFSWALKFPYPYTPKLLGSPKQLSQLLYVDLKIESKDKSTSDDVLENLPPHPVVVALRQYRKLKKQDSTYVLPLMDHEDEKGKLIKAKIASDGRMHTTFKLHGTATGRLASGDPMNMQNIPRDADIRGQFIASPGCVFIEPDFNQAELRCLAALSGDEALCAVYENQDPDAPGLHDTVRDEMFGNVKDWSQADFDRYLAKFFIDSALPENEAKKAILDEQKMRAKNVNFGIVYGITKYGLADQTGDSFADAQAYIDAWARKFPTAWKFIQDCQAAPRRGLDLVTPFGNKKRHRIVTEENKQALANEAANFPHQSIASHCMVHGGILVIDRYAKEYNAHICNTVHDSMLIDTPNDPKIIRTVTEDIIKVLESVPRMWGITRIPFVADAKIGDRWGRASQIGFDKWLKQKIASGELEP